MKILSLKLNSAVLVGGIDEAMDCLNNALNVLNQSQTLLESLRDWSEISNVPEDVYSDIQLVNCERMLEVLDTPGIDVYKIASLSRYPVLFERLEQFLFIKGQLKPVLEEIVDAYITLTSDERNTITVLCRAILQQLIFFVYYEFDFDKTLESIEKEEDLVLNEAVSHLCNKENKSLKRVALFVSELYAQYRPTIPSFDLDEETIDNFYFFAGLYSYSLLENIDDLTAEDVVAIATEKASVEEIIARLSGPIPEPKEGVRKLDLFGTNK